jgi:rare lipoprotein A
MPMRRTIGISLALLVISAGAMGKTPEKSTSDQPAHPHSVKPGKSEPRMARTRSSCNSAQARSSARYSAHHSGRVRHRYVARGNGGPPDSYLDPMHAAGISQTGRAAWYGLVGNYTSSGERLDMVTPTAAHRSLPLASYAKVTSLDSGRSVIVNINDRGPHSRRFIIDLSPRAADEIDMKRAGVAAVIVEPVVAGWATAGQPAPTVAAFQTSGFEIAQ